MRRGLTQNGVRLLKPQKLNSSLKKKNKKQNQKKKKNKIKIQSKIANWGPSVQTYYSMVVILIQATT